MSDMKCPFCQQELVEIQFGEQRYWSCINDRCNKSIGFGGNLKLWQELIRTRKALDVAKEGLKSAKKRLELINNSKFANLNNVLQIQSQCEVLKIDEALEQITALEQKEVK